MAAIKKGAIKKKLWCGWCEHIDYYLIGYGDQPVCKNCGRSVTKNQFIR